MDEIINHEAINQINSKILDNIKKRELEEKNEKTQFVYSIDWLTFNIKLKDINNPFIRNEGIYAEEREQGTNIFKRVKDFYNTRDELIFTIVFQPHSKIIKNDFGQIQIANKWLYVGTHLRRERIGCDSCIILIDDLQGMDLFLGKALPQRCPGQGHSQRRGRHFGNQQYHFQ